MKMQIGILKEIKADETRVALVPAGAEALTRAGHDVLVQAGAGAASGFRDEEYAAQGAKVVADGPVVWERADLIAKVKEPLPDEWPHVRRGQIVFCYFHFAADERLTRALLQAGCSAVAYETVTDRRGCRPLLKPMSEVAGRLGVHQIARLLERPAGGPGILLGGVPGVAPARVVVIGGGVVGSGAARLAAAMGARVDLLDCNLDRLAHLAEVMPANVELLYSDRPTLLERLAQADAVLGAVLVPGARAPRLLRRGDMRPGTLFIDVAIDQGGCAETSRPTTHKTPTFTVDGVTHYCVTNMPAAVSRTSTCALCAATLSYLLRLADCGLTRAILSCPDLVNGVNLHRGCVTNAAVAETFGLAYVPLEDCLD